MEFEFTVSGKTHKISVELKGEHYIIDTGNTKLDVNCQSISENCISFLIGNSTYTVYIASSENKRFLSIGGEQFCIEEKEAVSEQKISAGAGPVGNTVSSLMPGQVVKINIAEGEGVEENQTLVIVEAMKMENELKAPIKGVVKKIYFSQGDLVDAGKTIVELTPAKTE